MSRHALGWMLACLAVPLALTGCGDAASQEETAGAGAPAAEVQRPIPVSVAVVATGESRAQVKAWGTVHPARAAELNSEISGRVARRRVSLGETVARGQVLLEIDPDLHLARVREAKSRTESTRLSAEKAGKDRDRIRAMFDQGIASDAELEAAETRAAEAVAAHAGAQAALAQANKDLAAARVRAPFAGTVGRRPPDPGTTVTPGTPLVSVVDLHRVRVDALISEQDLPAVRTGSAVNVRVEGAPGGVFPGEVTAVGPTADAATRQFPVEIMVTNPEGFPLKGGMVAEVQVIHRRYEDVPLVPVDAVREDDAGVYVFTVRHGLAHKTLLTPGPREGLMMAALAGLAAGDSVVVLGQDRLADNVRVRVEEAR